MFVYLWVSQGKFMGFHCVHRTVEGTREAMKYERYHLTLLICKMKTVLCCAKLLWSCQILCESMDCNPPGSSVHGILQARILEWIATPSSRGSSWPRNGTWVPYVSSIGRQVLYRTNCEVPKWKLFVYKWKWILQGVDYPCAEKMHIRVCKREKSWWRWFVVL